jgi:hypothetical protein
MSMVFLLVAWTSLPVRDTQTSQGNEVTETCDFISNSVSSFLTLRERASNSNLSLEHFKQAPKMDGLALSSAHKCYSQVDLQLEPAHFGIWQDPPSPQDRNHNPCHSYHCAKI